MAAEVPYLSTRCPRCGDAVSMPPVSEPHLSRVDFELEYSGERRDLYAVLHLCTNRLCSGSAVGYYTHEHRGRGWHLWFHRPEYRAYEAPDEIPRRPRTLLQEANNARKFPTACTTTAVRAVEAMLAEKGYKRRQDSLKRRIEKAVENGALPPDMADWADEVRCIGNITHTDEKPASLPSDEDAERALLFANTLAYYLFVLPTQIKRGRKRKRKSK